MSVIRSAIILVFIFFFGTAAHSNIPADTAILRSHVNALTGTKGFRNYKNHTALNEAATYIYNCFSQYADTVFYQNFDVYGSSYKNVVCSFGPSDARVIVIGAHYDVCGNQMGADDNASGISALLELARMLKGEKLNYRIEIVAYSLEEPPYFETEFMGSFIHAQRLHESKADVYGMICFDLIGYFSDAEDSQDYPLSLMSVFYGKKGDFIMTVNKYCKGRFARRFTKMFVRGSEIRAKRFSGPKFIPGVDFSDHLNYWKFGYSSTFITNTAFYRNKNYHKQTDIPSTIDYLRMSKVVDAVFNAVIRIR